MPKSSVAAVPVARQFPVASGGASRNEPLAIIPGDVEGRVDAIRSLLAAEGRPGFNSDVASRMSWRRERVSREVQGTEKLSVALLLAEILMHRAEGRDETADRLLAAVNAGQPMKLKTTGAVVIRMSDGQMFLDLGPTS